MRSTHFKSVLICLLSACFISSSAISAEPQASIPTSYDAVKWYRDSAEAYGLYRQVFLMAGNIIQQKVLNEKLQPHEWGVIFDIDETLLNNSQWNYEHDILGKKEGWDAFAARAISVDTPGAKELINRIHAMGGYVDMVTNRKGFLKEATEKNLRARGLYFDQVLYYIGKPTDNWFPDKNSRFQAIIDGKTPAVMPQHKVIAWVGDNIQDMPNIQQTEIIKKNPYGNAYDKFGVTYFLLPNPMYGSWEYNKMR
jgi:5'-nucleotidase (lipoprotein e(P4) family)